jgi:23S rRNA (uracil1939-C5)-methyltransferase
MSDSPDNKPAALEFVPEKWVYGGQALGRVEGQVVMTPFTLPGETVRVETGRARAQYLEARLVQVLEPSADRIAPRCPLFTECGGCHYQHAGSEFQLARKVEILREVFRRVGKFNAPEEIETIAGEPWEYRNRAQFHLSGGRIGFHAAGSNRLVPLEGACPISAPAINETLAKLRGLMKDRRWPGFVRSLELFTNGTDTLINVLETDGGQHVARNFFNWASSTIKGGGRGELEYDAAGLRFRVSHGSFFQINRFLVDRLAEAAVSRAQGGTALDLYCGVGLFSLPLAQRSAQVTAIESSLSAVRDLDFNSSRAKLPIDVRRLNVDQYLEKLQTAPDFVLADPPRAGLGKAVVDHLARLKPARITVVSCDPATQARDLAGLLAGGYRLAGLTLVDLFPQTYHLETVAHLERA